MTGRRQIDMATAVAYAVEKVLDKPGYDGIVDFLDECLHTDLDGIREDYPAFYDYHEKGRLRADQPDVWYAVKPDNPEFSTQPVHVRVDDGLVSVAGSDIMGDADVYSMVLMEEGQFRRLARLALEGIK